MVTVGGHLRTGCGILFHGQPKFGTLDSLKGDSGRGREDDDDEAGPRDQQFYVGGTVSPSCLCSASVHLRMSRGS